jgi:hypothetical protein
LLAVPRDHEAALEEAAQTAGITVTRIGNFRSGSPGVVVRGSDGRPMVLDRGGWSHF